MKHRLLTCAMVLTALLLTAAPASAEAAFFPVRTYGGQFVDVPAREWYYDNVKALYELGLTSGQDQTHFSPASSMTAAEAMAMAARLRSLHDWADAEAGPAQYSPGGAWYSPYTAYLGALSVVDGDFLRDPERDITRAELAHVLARTLPESIFQEEDHRRRSANDQVLAASMANLRYLPDLTEDTPYLEDILWLYRWGIAAGSDERGAFLPNQPVSRSEAAALMTRLVYGELRRDLPWTYEDAYSAQGLSMRHLVRSDGSFYSAPSAGDRTQIEADIARMLSRGERRISLRYPPNTLNQKGVTELLDDFLSAARLHVEQTYNSVQCSFTPATGELVVDFSSSLYGADKLDHYRTAAMEAAARVHDEMWRSGAITPETSDYDIARLYYTWICEHCRFDYDCGDDSMSHSGWRVFYEGLAVCDGYTAAYNLLLKLEGIDCATVSTPDHIWTVAELDGTTYHIDTTWGDMTTGGIDYKYFAMSEKEALGRF